ncbi:hypothetical protein [Bdellovibrio sp. NC01]|uniref:hypothetical protein n=1 Tax=Bdellovibrio sp. NC01 TaxID=2220073 RepID=UPI001157A4A9|nr:hypothetical protein [Bdellovibrio sp. NC01]QDK37924.1 hypothetical protein DOE51_10175 [Bdellovibrio sp. NC01]
MLDKITFLIISTLLLSSCANELDHKQEEPPSGVRILSESQVHISFTPNDSANSYQAIITWPEAQGTIRILENSKVLATLSGQFTSYSVPVQGGTEVSYLVEHLSTDNKIISSVQILGTVPKDLFWDKETTLEQDTIINAGRIYISKDAKILTKQFNLTIIADTIKAEGGLITNFADGESQKAIATNGLKGGNISISAQKASGNLAIEMRGQNGGEGKSAVMGAFGSTQQCFSGPGGNGGNSGELKIDIADGTTLALLVNRYVGMKGPNGGAPWSHGKDTITTGTCQTVKPQPGTDGTFGRVCIKLRSTDTFECR